MCLIVFAWQVVPGVPLIAAANRDEFYERAAAPAAAWPDAPQVFAGRDLLAGGSWMGITRAAPVAAAAPAEEAAATAAAPAAEAVVAAGAAAAVGLGGEDCGQLPLRANCNGSSEPAAVEQSGAVAPSRFAAITNIRNPSDVRADAPSRGHLVTGFLQGAMSARDYVAQIAGDAASYNGFNLILCDGKELLWYSNKAGDDPRNGLPLAPGVYGLSNALLDSPWPKVLRTKAQFASLLCLGAPEEAYFEMLSDTTIAPDMRLPDTGVPIEWERLLSAVKIESPAYGTRCSTVVKLYADTPGVLHEQTIR